MVSGFLISPYDQDRIFSGDAIEIRIWSKTWAGVVGLKRFIISWFIVFSSHADLGLAANSKISYDSAFPDPRGKSPPRPRETRGRARHVDYSAASDVDAGPSL